MTERLFTPEEVARATNYSRDTIYRALAAGDLVGLKAGRGKRARWRIRPRDVDAWLRAVRP
jgi:excisionase family DNA binding protein